MLRQEEKESADSVGRARIGDFSDKQIALLKTFADQAVIAIQNTRMFNETEGSAGAPDRHRRGPAVISSSVFDAAPVFERSSTAASAVPERAARLSCCVDKDGMVHMNADRVGGTRARRDRAKFTQAARHTTTGRRFASAACPHPRRVNRVRTKTPGAARTLGTPDNCSLA